MTGTLRILGVASAAAVLLLTAFVVRAQQPPQAMNQSVRPNPAPPPPPAQPVPFSHKTHAGAGMPCQMCHTNPEPGRLMTFPATTTCMTCHASVAADRPAIVRLAELAKSDRPVPWVRVYEVLPGVTWAHRRHVQAGIQCETCHGPVAGQDAMAKITSVTAMASCMSCHDAAKARNTCETCHAWPTD